MNNNQNPQGIPEMPMPQQPMAQPGMPMPQQPMAQPGMPMPQQPMTQPGMPMPQQPMAQPGMPMPQQPMTQPGMPVNPQNSADANDLIGAFIGKNYDKIKTGGISLPGFLLNGIYLLYRKMYLYGLLIFVVAAALVFFLKNPLVCLIFPVACGVFGNKIYLSYAEKKVANIKIKNQDKDNAQLIELCKKSGGTSPIFMIIGIILEVAVIALSVFSIMNANVEEDEKSSSDDTAEVDEVTDDDEIADDNSDATVSTDDVTGATVFTYDMTDTITNSLLLTPPTGFVDKSDGMKYIFENKSNLGENDSCIASLSKVNNVTDAYSFATEMSTKNNSTDLNTITVNNINWNYFSVVSDTGTKYYYSTDYNGKVFLYEYTVQTNAVPECLTAKDVILSTIVPVTPAQ